MSSLFLSVLNLAISASWLILAVILVRFLLKKTPKWIICLLWGIVAVRLVFPFSFESAFSLLPSSRTIPENIEIVQDPHIESGIGFIDNAVNPVMENSFSPDVTASVNPMQVVTFASSVIWVIGMVAMILYAIISFVMLKRKVRASITVADNVMACDEVKSPFILGVLRPVIYVPSGMDGETFDLVMAHEKAHLKRHDHWLKPLGFVLLSVYWFNPLSWIAYVLLCRDIESACDEKVIADRDREYVAAYSQALLNCSIQRKAIAVCPLAFGENGVKDRVRGILNYKKPAFWLILVSVVACLILAVCFLTNPPHKLTIPDDPAIFTAYDNQDGYIGLQWEEKGLIYVPYMPLDPKLAGDCIGYFEYESGASAYVCAVKDLSETEWICDSLTSTVNGHSEGMIYREINVKKVPTGWSSDYDWNLPYTDYVGDASTVSAIAMRLPYPEGYKYDHIEIQSSEEPYGLTVYLQGDASVDMNAFLEASDKAFESIGNLGSITFTSLDSGEIATIFAHEELITENVATGKSSNESENATSHNYFPDTDNQIGVSMTATDITPTGCTLMFLQKDGIVTGELETGQWYELQVKNGNGEWIDNSARDIEIAWEDIAYTIDKDGTTSMDVNWEHYYGLLLDGHYRIVKKVMDYRAPGDYDEYEIYAEFYIGDETSKEKVTDWMDITLPHGYSISAFDDTIGLMGGSLILPMSYEVYDTDDSGFSPIEWRYSGLISRVPASSTEIEFSNGIPKESGVPMENHSEASYSGVIGLERSSNQWPAIMLKVNHDLYTPAQLDDLEKSGIHIEESETTSDYWEFWFVKEGEDTYYVLTLSAKEFSEKEATDIALGVIIK